MKTKSILSSLLLIAALPLTSQGQQTQSGEINYSITVQRPSRRQSDQNFNTPQKFTRENTLFFDGSKGKWEPAKQETGRRGPRGETYLNFESKEFLRAFKRRDNDTTFLIPSSFKTAKYFQLTGKKEKMLGYNCLEATATLRNQKVTFWFTKDLPLTFSPINGLIPPSGGVVLAIQSDRMQAKATDLKLGKVDANQLLIPQPSKELSREQLRQMFRHRGGRRPMHRRN